MAAIDDGLASGQLASLRTRGDPAEITETVAFVETEGGAFGAGDDGLDAIGLAEGGIEAQGHEIAQQRLRAQRPADFLEDGGDVETGAAETAIGLGDQGSHDAQLGEAGPALGIVIAALIGDLVAVFRRIGVGEEAAQAVRNHPAIIGGCEIHDQAPNVSLVMMLRWISLDPPKIDSLRLLK